MNSVPPELGETVPDFYPEWTFGITDMEKCMLYVPVGSGDKYRTAEGWRQFKNIIETTEFPTNISPVLLSGQISVSGLNGEIVITGESKQFVEVYDFGGSRVFAGTICDERVRISLPPGFYIVRIGIESFKVKI